MIEHKLITHYPKGLICHVCGAQLDRMSKYDEHYQTYHATLDEKITFSREIESNYLYKLYFISFGSTTFKIGITRRPLYMRLCKYKEYRVIKVVQLPLIINSHRCFAHQLENKIHLHISKKFKLVENKLEYFTFNDSETSESQLISELIDRTIVQSDLTEPLRIGSCTSSNKLYLIYNERSEIAKIGYTTQPINSRLRVINEHSSDGNFDLVDLIHVDPAATIHELKAWENDLLLRIYYQFDLMKFEHFKCSKEMLDVAKAIFRKIV
jgi:hypothetical protein